MKIKRLAARTDCLEGPPESETGIGFYLDDAMRQDGNRPYFLHVVGGNEGISDLAGNPIDLQSNEVGAATGLVIPFTVDARTTAGRPNFENNLAVSVVLAEPAIVECLDANDARLALRPLRATVEELAWAFDRASRVATLEFGLAAGCYATTLLDHLFDVSEERD